MSDLLQVGAILDTHGLKGEVKVFPTTDDATRYDYLKDVILIDKDNHEVSLTVEAVRYFKNLVIVKFKGIGHINDVEKYKKCNLYVTRENAVALEENEYFVADLIGLKVISDEGEALGVIADVLNTGANDVYVVRGQKEELLIPAIKQCILDVSMEDKTMKVHLLDGLRELNQKDN
ncbi:MAG: ribosome maturation factor RimM [bacterium]|nr:ribosome maturation factor RimM [bacterium]